MKKALLVLCCVFCSWSVLSANAASPTGPAKDNSNNGNAYAYGQNGNNGNAFGQFNDNGNNGRYGGGTDVAPVPEPATMVLVGLGMAGAAILGRKKKR